MQRAVEDGRLAQPPVKRSKGGALQKPSRKSVPGILQYYCQRARIAGRRVMKTPQRGHRFLTVATILFVVSLLPRLAIAQEKAPLPLMPGSFRWVSPPNNPALMYPWILEMEGNPGPTFCGSDSPLEEGSRRIHIPTNEIRPSSRGRSMLGSVKSSTRRRLWQFRPGQCALFPGTFHITSGRGTEMPFTRKRALAKRGRCS